MWRFRTVNDGTIKTRAAVIADITRNIDSSADGWREARQLENDTEQDGKYWQSSLNEGMAAVFIANCINGDIIRLGGRDGAKFAKPTIIQ